MSDWDAARYDRISNPQVAWGRRVIARLEPAVGERVLDLGCGTGRLTSEIAGLTGSGLVVGLDRSAAMLQTAHRLMNARASAAQHAPIRLVRADGTNLPFVTAFDAVFTAATLHWISDHEGVFGGVFRALRPGGRFVGQCGGGPNLHRLYERAESMMRKAPYRSFFSTWRTPWNFAVPDSTSGALARAGFVAIDVSLEAAPVTFSDSEAYQEFIACVCVRPHLERLPGALREGFVGALTQSAQSDDPPLTLDYWRLNINARRSV